MNSTKLITLLSVGTVTLLASVSCCTKGGNLSEPSIPEATYVTPTPIYVGK